MGLMEAVDLLLEKVLVRYLFLRLAGFVSTSAEVFGISSCAALSFLLFVW